jgi:hypothetical protein
MPEPLTVDWSAFRWAMTLTVGIAGAATLSIKYSHESIDMYGGEAIVAHLPSELEVDKWRSSCVLRCSL